MSALPRTTCPWCERSVPVRRNGELREHTPHPGLRRLCEGSGAYMCEGHEPGPNDPMGITVYCDGACVVDSPTR